MSFKIAGTIIGTLLATMLLVGAQFTQDQPASNEKRFKEEWTWREQEFRDTLKTLNPKSTERADCVGKSVWQGRMGGNDRGVLQILAPVPRTKIRAVRAFAREEADGYPWWECPFELDKQCGQIVAPNNPNATVKPGGIAYLPFSLQDTDDQKTLITTEVLGWAPGKVRDIRFEVDYLNQ